MKTNMKRQSLLLFGWLLLAMPASVQAQFTYTTNNGTITITGYTGSNAIVVIPDTITGLPVTVIREAFSGDTSLTSVIIPSSVTSIGNDAFSHCDNLTNAIIPGSVTSIGDWAFTSCLSLSSVTIPNSVTRIGYYAFAGTSLTSVTIPNSVTSIGLGPFSGGPGVKAITVETNNPAYSSVNGVLFDKSRTTLVQYPAGNVAISYAIPNSVTNIENYAFAGCSSLTNVIIPNSVTSIGDSAFFGCSSLANVIIPNSVTRIGDFAFDGCYSLASVTIPNSVTIIGEAAFSGTNLTSVTIPNSVINIGSDAFSDCSSLVAITVDSANPNYSSIGGVLFDKGQKTLIQYPRAKTGASYTIPYTVTSIGFDAFFDCSSSLTSVTIPGSVTNIGDFAFDVCLGLTNVFFEGNAPAVGRHVFDDNGRPPLFDPATAYYLPGTTVWDSTFAGIPTALWTLPYPLILNNNLGVRSNQFGFTVSWATNLSVVVEASTDLNNPKWSPLTTNALSGGTFYFSDPQWGNYPSQFYRVRPQ
jgi:hypothetical protein